MKSFAENVIEFNKKLKFTGTLPDGIGIMNPFQENPEVLPVSSEFYRKYYSDRNPRHLILGINPGRFGGGVTGVPFTDPKRLIQSCKISYTGDLKHEPSSVYVYDMIEAFGGPEAFYRHFYINSICPLGFTTTSAKGQEINYNYYDSKALTAAAYDFIVESIKKHIALGIKTDVCFCFGTGQNEKFLRKLNAAHQFFDEIIGLEHPRFIMQYKSKTKQFYIDKYLQAFASVLP